MDDDRLARLAPLTGVVFVALLIAGAAVIAEWDYLPSGDDLVELFSENDTRVMLGSYLGMASTLFLVWFSGSVRTRLRQGEGEPGRLAAVAFGGGVGAAVLIAAGFGAMFAAASRGGDGTLSADSAIVFNELAGALVGIVAPIMLAAFIGAAAVVGFRTSTFATWFNWVSAVLAVALISPVAWMVLYAVPLWVLWTSVSMYREQTVAVT